jgi:hypothetical protein
LAKGESSGRGFEKLDQMGAIKELPGSERYKQLATDYADAVSRRKTALVVSPTHAEGERVTAEIREELKQRGKLGTDERKLTRVINQQWTEAQRSNPQSYHPGLIVQFHQNAPGFTRGQKLTVSSVGHDGSVYMPRTNMDGNTRYHWAKAPDSKFTKPRHCRWFRGIKSESRKTDLRRWQTPSEQRSRVPSEGVHQDRRSQADERLGHRQGLRESGSRLLPDLPCRPEQNRGSCFRRAIGGVSGCFICRAILRLRQPRQRQPYMVYTDDKARLAEAIQSSGARMTAHELLKLPTVANTSDPFDSILRGEESIRPKERFSVEPAAQKATRSQESNHVQSARPARDYGNDFDRRIDQKLGMSL